MSRRHQFYLTLPSNSSTGYYPNNTLTNYVTHLPASIHLEEDGEWEVALVEAHYPYTFVMVPKNTTMNLYVKEVNVRTREITADTQVVEITVPHGIYKKVSDILYGLNQNETMVSIGVEFTHDENTDMIALTVTSTDTVTAVTLSTNLALILGYDLSVTTVYPPSGKPQRPSNLHAILPAHMFVYCDLVEPQLVGDTSAPLLKIINIDMKEYKYGADTTVHFTSPHYVPVIKSNFETVEIDLRDKTGKKLPFQSGTAYMKLHLRRAAA